MPSIFFHTLFFVLFVGMERHGFESDDEAQEANEVVEWDDEAQDEADEAVESNLV